MSGAVSHSWCNIDLPCAAGTASVWSLKRLQRVGQLDPAAILVRELH